MVLYFSGTGNSRYAAQIFASELKDGLVNAGIFIREHRKARFESESPWVFVCPTYAWRLPHIFADFILDGSFSGSRDAYFVMTCGSEIGNAEAGIRKLCDKKKFTCKGVLQVIMPENYIAMFPVPGMEESARIIAAARPVISSGVEFIRSGAYFPKKNAAISDKIKSGPINPLFYKLFVTARPFYVTDACTGCGRCERVCPLNNIKITNGKPTWHRQCTHCMACICGCPNEAIEYGKISVGKPRYICKCL